VANIQEIGISSYNLQNFNSLADNYCEKVQKISLFFTTDQMPDIQISEALLQLSLFVRLKNLNLHQISSGSNRNVHQIDVSLSMIAQN
jgi:hypothetical protein